jgi:hypothetical protein
VNFTYSAQGKTEVPLVVMEKTYTYNQLSPLGITDCLVLVLLLWYAESMKCQVQIFLLMLLFFIIISAMRWALN